MDFKFPLSFGSQINFLIDPLKRKHCVMSQSISEYEIALEDCAINLLDR